MILDEFFFGWLVFADLADCRLEWSCKISSLELAGLLLDASALLIVKWGVILTDETIEERELYACRGYPVFLFLLLYFNEP